MDVISQELNVSIKNIDKPNKISNPCILTYASAYMGSEKPVVRGRNRVERYSSNGSNFAPVSCEIRLRFDMKSS